MNWHYNAEDDYYIDPKNVRFNFKRYAYRHDTYGYKRNFKVYEAEKFDEDRKEDPNALTKKEMSERSISIHNGNISRGK